MVNTRKLRGRILECGFTYEDMAEKLCMSACTFGRKVRGVAAMTLMEAEQLMIILDIPKTELTDYFFLSEN